MPGIPEWLESTPVHAEVTGRFYALRGQTCDTTGDGVCQAWERWPLPVPTGVSVGHPDITAGTIAARVKKDTEVFILSNNHVLANINQGIPGDPILQPGTFDGGTADDAIANLTDFQPIAFCDVFFIWLICDQTNTMDAAIAESDPGKLGVTTPNGGYGAPSSTLHPAYGSPNYDLSAPGPAIARVRNATGSSFEVGLGRPWYGTFGGEDFYANVYCMVVRQGVYTAAEDGVKMEAMKLPEFAITAHAGSWSGQRQPYQNSYSHPVVVGQVVSSDTGKPPSYCPHLLCERDWSVFWSRGTAVSNPPSSSTLYVSRHTGEDSGGRAPETLVYLVFERGTGIIEGRKYLAALGADTVRGMQNRPPFNYNLSGLASASAAIVSQAGMDGAEGGWAVLYGSNAVSATRLRLAIDEDWYLDSDRNHTAEQVSYIVFE